MIYIVALAAIKNGMWLYVAVFGLTSSSPNDLLWQLYQFSCEFYRTNRGEKHTRNDVRQQLRILLWMWECENELRIFYHLPQIDFQHKSTESKWITSLSIAHLYYKHKLIEFSDQQLIDLDYLFNCIIKYAYILIGKLASYRAIGAINANQIFPLYDQTHWWR